MYNYGSACFYNYYYECGALILVLYVYMYLDHPGSRQLEYIE
jgi:hypothetical protein